MVVASFTNVLFSYGLLAATIIIELVAFLTTHMIDSRHISSLHDGIFQRCVYTQAQHTNVFYCLWWSPDMFSTDPSMENIHPFLLI